MEGPCLFSVFWKIIKDGDSEAVFFSSKDQTLIPHTNNAISCYLLGVRNPSKKVDFYRGTIFRQKCCVFKKKLRTIKLSNNLFCSNMGGTQISLCVWKCHTNILSFLFHIDWVPCVWIVHWEKSSKTSYNLILFKF